MALPYPFQPVTKPAYNEDRGQSFYDTVTKSTKQKISAYLKEDTCGRQVYLSLAGAASINQLVNCIPVLAESFSFSFLVPVRVANGAMDSVTNIVNSIEDQLSLTAATNSIYTVAEVTAAVTAALALAPDADIDDDDDQLTNG